MRSFMWGSRADSSGFRLAKGGRTLIRIQGTFAALPDGGTVIAYRIELLPAAVVSLAIATPLSLVIISVLLWLADQSQTVLLWFIPIALFVVGFNWWFSEMQARWLVRFLSRTLEAK